MLARRNTLIQIQLEQFEAKQTARNLEIAKRTAEKNLLMAKPTVSSKWKAIMFIIISLKRVLELVTKYRKGRKGAYL